MRREFPGDSHVFSENHQNPNSLCSVYLAYLEKTSAMETSDIRDEMCCVREERACWE
jgi:hypothetical protein